MYIYSIYTQTNNPYPRYNCNEVDMYGGPRQTAEFGATCSLNPQINIVSIPK